MKEIKTIFVCLLAVILSSGTVFAQNLEKSIAVSYQSPILVKRGGVDVTLADFNAYLDWQVPKRDQVSLVANPARIERILENIALAESFYGLAQQQGLLEDPIVRARLYQAMLREVRSVYRDWYHQDIELDSYEARAREIYLVDSERFMGPVRYDMRHLLIPVDSERGAIEAMQDVVDAYEKIAEGQDFSSVIAEYTVESAASSNGLLENIQLRELVPSVATAVESTEVGEVSLPVQSSFGWHIVEVVAMHPAKKLSWEEARPAAEAVAREQHLVQSFERVLREFNARPMQFADGAVQSILDYYGLDGFGINAIRTDDQADEDSGQ